MMRVLLFCFVLCFLCGCSKVPESPAENVKTTESPQPLPEAIMSLGVTVKVFSERFNSAMTDMKQPFRITEFEIDNSDKPASFKYLFNSHIGLIGAVTPSNKIIDFTMIGSGEGTIESGLNIMFVMNALIRAVNPEMSKQEAAKMVMQLMENSAVKIANGKSGSSSIILNGVEYTCTQGQAIGTWLIVSKP